jgi:hypothetical protein
MSCLECSARKPQASRCTDHSGIARALSAAVDREIMFTSFSMRPQSVVGRPSSRLRRGCSAPGVWREENTPSRPALQEFHSEYIPIELHCTYHAGDLQSNAEIFSILSSIAEQSGGTGGTEAS